MFENKIAVVTGGANGIGRACAVMLAMRGARVAAVDRDWSDGDDRFEEANQASGSILRVDADCGKPAEVQAAFEFIRQRLGDPEILVANAGGSDRGVVGTTESSPVESWQRMLDDNFMSAALCSREVIPAMRRRQEGRIIHITTQAAVHGWHKNTPYVAAKGAQAMLAFTMAKELAHDRITVNIVAPGAVMTRALRQLPSDYVRAAAESCQMQRIATPEEIAEIVMFFAGPHAGYVTGQQLVADGGLVIG